MKIDDTVPVTIAGQVVAQARVRELGDGTATLVVPATLVVMATRTELTVETPNSDPTEAESIITGVDRTSAQPEAPVESATVGENPPLDNSSTNGTSEVSQASGETTQAPVAVAETPPAAPVENPQGEALQTNESASNGASDASPE